MPGYISPEEYGLIKSQDWEEPISLESVDLPEFPVDALPKPIAAFVLEVSEMLQVYPDMPAFCALGVLSLCFQKKFAVRVNEDWLEPINLYLLVVADPSERKSPCLKEMTAPVRDFEEIWNRDHEAEIELSHEVVGELLLRDEREAPDDRRRQKQCRRQQVFAFHPIISFR